MESAYLQVIVLLHAAFAGVFLFLHRQRPTRFARLFAWSWGIEAVRAALLFPEVHHLGGSPEPWFSGGDILCFVANWCLLAGFADLFAVRLPRWLAPVYFAASIPLVLLNRFGLPVVLEAQLGLPPDRAHFYGVLTNLVIMFVPVAVARTAILKWLFTFWRKTRVPGALVATIFCVPYALVAIAVPLQFYYSYQPDWLALFWCLRVLGFSIGLVIMMLSLQHAALEKSEANMAAAQALAKLGSWELDPLTGKGTWSAEVYRLFARDPAHGPMSFAEVEAIIHPDDREDFRRHEIEAGTVRHETYAEFRIIRPDGEVRWMAGRSHPHVEAGGAVVRMIGSLQDVTERRQAEVRIQQLNRVYAVLSGINETIVRLREPAAIFAAACHIAVERGGFAMAWVGRVAPEISGVSVVAHAGASSDVLQVLHRILADTARGGPGCSVTMRALRGGETAVCNEIEHDPETVTWRTDALHFGYRAMVALPLKLNGEVWGTFNLYARERGSFDADELNLLSELAVDISFAVDVSRRETERERTEAALHTSEERFRQLAENIREVFWLTDPAKNVVLYVSPAYETIWGRPVASLYASPRTWLDAIHAEDSQRVLDAALTRQREGTYDEEYRVVRPDGSVRWIRDRAFPVRDLSGSVHRIAGVAEDITDRKVMEERLRQSQKLEAIGQLSGGVAHDFNNLLTVIIGNISLLQSDPALDPATAQLLQEVSGAAERAAALTQQLLVFSRRQMPVLRDIDLNVVVADMAKLLRRVLGENIAMEVVSPESPILVRADPGMIEQVLLNLVVNARDAMPDGGRLRIETGPVDLSSVTPTGANQAREGSFACLTVGDTGGGIAPEVLPHIFEPYFTTKAVGKGTGLGLATVYGIVQQHEGWITPETDVGHGTTFRVFIPRIASRATVPTGESSVDARAWVDPGETILVVEDEESVRRFVQNALTRRGHRVLVAESGTAALELWRGHRDEIRLVITDLVMPGEVSGFALADRLRQEKPELRVIYTTGYSAELTGQKRKLDQRVNFLPKPFNLEQLLAIVRANLDHLAS